MCCCGAARAHARHCMRRLSCVGASGHCKLYVQLSLPDSAAILDTASWSCHDDLIGTVCIPSHRQGVQSRPQSRFASVHPLQRCSTWFGLGSHPNIAGMYAARHAAFQTWKSLNESVRPAQTSSTFEKDKVGVGLPDTLTHCSAAPDGHRGMVCCAEADAAGV